MPGSTNQIQTPFGSGVRTAVGLAAGVAGGVSNIPINPSAAVTGTLYGALFNTWQGANLANGFYTTPLTFGTYAALAANGQGVTFPTLTAIDFGAIQVLTNAFTGTLATITSLTASSLIQMSSDFTMTLAACTTFSFSALQYIGGSFSPSLSVLTSLNMPALIAVNGSVAHALLLGTSLLYPNLQYVGGSFSAGATIATTIDLSSLQYVGGLFNPSFPQVTTLSLPAIVRVLAAVSFTAPNLVTFSFGSTLKQIGNNVIMTGMKLNQASVDGILVSLAALDGTNGTTAFSSLAVTLTGGTSSAPSATGLTAKGILQGRGCTVTTN